MPAHLGEPGRIEAATPVAPNDVLAVRGADATDLLHRICASEVRGLASGTARHLVFTDDRGGVVDAPLGFADGEAILLVAGPDRGPALRAWIERWIIVDDVRVEPAGGEWWRLGEPDLARSGLVLPGSLAGAAVLRGPFDGTVVDAAAWQALLLRAGRLHAGPATASGPNPLELGWKDLVAFDKGCYIGQEVVARLDTYDKVKRQVGVASLDAPVAAGETLSVEERKRGAVLESVQVDGAWFAWVLVDKRLEAGATFLTEKGTAGTLLKAPAVHRS